MSAPRNAVTIVGLALVAVMSLLVALLMAEGAVRIRHWVRHGSAAPLEDSLSVDAATGLRIPHGNDRVHINGLGFRGPEIEARKPAGTVRLAFLGGSTTFCAEASSDETTWPHVVWRELSAAKAPHTFDYINAGVPGYRIVHLTQTLRQRVAPLAPDVVVIYEATNDLSVDSRELARRQGLVGPELAETSTLARFSFLWFLIEKNVALRTLQANALNDEGKLRYDARALSVAFEHRLTELVHASQAVAPVVALATFAPRLRRGQPDAERQRAAVTALYYMPYMTLDGLLDGYEEYNAAIRRVAAATGALLIEGADTIPADDTHYADSVHFTDAGSAAMAARVASALLASPALTSLLDGARTARLEAAP